MAFAHDIEGKDLGCAGLYLRACRGDIDGLENTPEEPPVPLLSDHTIVRAGRVNIFLGQGGVPRTVWKIPTATSGR